MCQIGVVTLGNVEAIEKVQKEATKLVISLKKTYRIQIVYFI